jgi:hypothetical protein
VEQTHLGVRLVLDQLGLVVEERPAVIGLEIDDIALPQAVGGHDLRSEAAAHHALGGQEICMEYRIFSPSGTREPCR